MSDLSKRLELVSFLLVLIPVSFIVMLLCGIYDQPFWPPPYGLAFLLIGIGYINLPLIAIIFAIISKITKKLTSAGFICIGALSTTLCFLIWTCLVNALPSTTNQITPYISLLVKVLMSGVTFALLYILVRKFSYRYLSNVWIKNLTLFFFIASILPVLFLFWFSLVLVGF